ncbi:hypothetical protein NQ314_008997 [Rhamnusium bicolor]|uniref:Regulatory protein zeste n=1 Tax=Rhamnusium bicolor TaxID=1586634 RepID=A0AAV8Y5M3_9CUCU|nr:hypothetical protein NQ314_008997 [Rhamnusium bicolor]
MAEAKRTSQKQMAAIVDFIEVHKILLNGKCHPLQAKELEEKWSELSEILNNIPNGARKDVKQWKTAETRLMNVCGWVSITGCNELPEEIDPDAESIFKRDIEVSTIEIDLINEATEFEVLDQPAVETTPITKKLRNKNTTVTSQLERSAEMYNEGNKEMADALITMAKSISELAEAMSEVAKAVCAKTDATI